MSAKASELEKCFSSTNGWNAKIAARLTEIWEEESGSWTEKKRAEFKSLCSDARVTRSTIIPSSHKIHRKIQGREATEAEYTVLCAMFGSHATQKLPWAAEFKRRHGTLPIETGVVTQYIKRKMLKVAWKEYTTMIREAEKAAQTPNSEEPRSGLETHGALTQPNANNKRQPEHQLHKDRTLKAYLFEGIQKRVDQSMVEDVAKQKCHVKSPTAVLRGMKPSTGLNGRDAVPVERQKRENNSKPSIERGSLSEDVATDEKAQTEHPTGRVEGPSPERHGQRTGRMNTDVWEMLRHSRPTNILKAKVEALEARCAAQEERMTRLEETVSRKDEELNTLRQHIDTVARYLTQNV